MAARGNMFDGYDVANTRPRDTKAQALRYAITKLRSVGINVKALVLDEGSHNAVVGEYVLKALADHKEDMARWSRAVRIGILNPNEAPKPECILGDASPEQIRRLECCGGVDILARSDVEYYPVKKA